MTEKNLMIFFTLSQIFRPRPNKNQKKRVCRFPHRETIASLLRVRI